MDDPIARPPPSAGIIKRIRLENFMCHSNLEIELGDSVNFITGQNGSGKSAILTALCVAFGCRAKGTQRASTLKDFIKTGCSYAVVHVEVKNEGEEAFKPLIFGDVITIERRITDTTCSTILKDHRGKKVAGRKEELRELVEHFNIDVENPCVIMSQDKSREFLHSGSDKDRFKFYFKATLLQQVSELLENIDQRLKSANGIVFELEDSIKPQEKELDEIQEKIDNIKHVEIIGQKVQELRKKLAWAWVYETDKKLLEQSEKIKKLKDRIPICQARIDHEMGLVEKFRKILTKQKTEIAHMMEKTSEDRRRKDELKQKLSAATKAKFELEEELNRNSNVIKKMDQRVKSLEQQVQDIHEQNVKNTQAEESQIEKKLNELQLEVDAADEVVTRLREEESALSEHVNQTFTEIRKLTEEIDNCEKKLHHFSKSIHDLQQNQSNKVYAFGGQKVISLLQVIERHHRRFKRPPIGPIGVHLTLVNGDTWGSAIEQAIGKLLNSFIVTDHKDFLLLKQCAKDANYDYLQIVVYDFSRPKLKIPDHMLPQTEHPTTLSLLRSENHVVLNVLIDLGNVERQVLVRDYDVGKVVAFDQRCSDNVKEVYTLTGHKLFSSGSSQTILPPNKNFRGRRLCSSYDDQIQKYEMDASRMREEAQQYRKRKMNTEEELKNLQEKARNVKRRRHDAEREFMSKNLEMQDFKRSYVAEASASAVSTFDELHQEIAKTQEAKQKKEMVVEKLRVTLNEAEANASSLKVSFEDLCESAKGEIDAFDKAEEDYARNEEYLRSAEREKVHYENVMKKNVIDKIEEAEKLYQELEHERKENVEKASTICPESEIEAIGGCDSTMEQLNARLTTLKRRHERESQRYSESIDELMRSFEGKKRKIMGKQQKYKSFREKLDVLQRALESRQSKLQRNATFLKRELTWRFNWQLSKKGISGHANLSYEGKTLGVEVNLPHDASTSGVRDTKGLSGGERSFSTLCFAMALHAMIEAPFRAMDEFDVFMDAVSRKISLDTLVDFALGQGSQWIFITPHDISMVKQGDRIKKQQMAAPRS
ncbi:hypothetical protein UlMin_026461 [Ulmus minor]